MLDVEKTPAEEIVEKIVQAMPLATVKAHFAPGEIESIAESENRTYGEREIRFQLYTDLVNGDKELNELLTPPDKKVEDLDGLQLRVVEVNVVLHLGIFHTGTITVDDGDGDLLTFDIQTNGLPKSYQHSTSDI